MFRLFKSTRIKTTRKNLRNPDWVIEEYKRLLNKSKSIENFETFECSDFFKGKELADHNRKRLVKKRAKNKRKIRFIKEILKEVATKYYIDYIGELTDEDKKRLNRSNNIDKILN
jgi:hypothetical protein